MLYPRQPGGLRFDHARHAALACERCHRDLDQPSAARDDHFPREAVCRPCHAALTRPDPSPSAAAGPAPTPSPPPTARATPAPAPAADPARCRTCHPGWQAGANSPPRPWRPRPRLRFSHPVHAAAGLDCATCHRFAAPASASPAGSARSPRPGPTATPPYPPMAACTACHAERRAPNRCATCHLTEKDGRLVTRFGAERLVPTSAARGDAHLPLFARQHASAARAGRDRCLSCHQERDCLSCHAGLVRPMSIHGGDYLTAHALDARRDQPRCASCHRSQSFCLSCHQRLGVAQGGHKPTAFRPDTARAFHPPGFNAATRGPEHHAWAARRNVATCTSCHTEQTCLTCHADAARGGGGFSPHGPAFARSARCAALARRNPRVCLKCHAAGAPELGCDWAPGKGDATMAPPPMLSNAQEVRRAPRRSRCVDPWLRNAPRHPRTKSFPRRGSGSRALQEWQVAAIQAGAAQADREEGVELDEVKRRWENRLADSAH
ncbi:MAG: cytochrome c3 family protein [Proteobacteria bacterium]|nr:cytochrome c3 family protein [Pseudomonadota bacterium]